METFEFAGIKAEKTPKGWVFTNNGVVLPKPPLEQPGLLVCTTLDALKRPMFRTILDLDEAPSLQKEENPVRQQIIKLSQGSDEFIQFEVWTIISHSMQRMLEMFHKEQEFVQQPGT
jgi:hypothetical protein